MVLPITLDRAREIVQRPKCGCDVPRVRARRDSHFLACVNNTCKLRPWASQVEENRARRIIAKDARDREEARVAAAIHNLPIAERAKGKRFTVRGAPGLWVHIDGRMPVDPGAECDDNETVARVMRSDGGMLVRKFRRLEAADPAEKGA